MPPRTDWSRYSPFATCSALSVSPTLFSGGSAPDRSTGVARRSSPSSHSERGSAANRHEISAIDVIKAEDIADFPDNNLAESLQRVPGVTMRSVTVASAAGSMTANLELAIALAGYRNSRNEPDTEEMADPPPSESLVYMPRNLAEQSLWIGFFVELGGVNP